MGPKATYELYLALKLHFTSDYDFHKYGGKVSAKVVDSLDKKGRMRFSLEKIGKMRDPKGFMLSNILADPDWKPFDARDDRSKFRYNQWLQKSEALRHTFENDLNRLIFPFHKNFLCGEHPPSLLLTWMSGSIDVTTVIILLALTGAGPKWLKYLDECQSPMYHSTFRLTKAVNFLDFKRDVFRKMVIEKFSDDYAGVPA